MHHPASLEMLVAMAAEYAIGACVYPALVLPRRGRLVGLGVALLAVFACPLIIRPAAGFLRLGAAVNAVMVAVKLIDLYLDPNQTADFRRFLVNLSNPFCLVQRKVTGRPRPPWQLDLLRFVLLAAAGTIALLALIGVFQIDWRGHHLILEHCAKVIGLFLVIALVANAFSSLYRLIGLPALNFSGNFFLAGTPAEFWRLYNQPAAQFLYEDVFKPLGGLRRPVIGTLLTFAISSIIHEYVFDIAAGRVLGWQMEFFLIQGLGVAGTLKVRIKGWTATPAVLFTFAFNLATASLFFASLNQLIPFYVCR